MKIIKDYPPNYREICSLLPVEHLKNVVFCYGNTIYSPDCEVLPDDVEVHECVHSIQQANYPGGVDAWWREYMVSIDFRIRQELEAYRKQYRFIREKYGRQKAREIASTLAHHLSGQLYGRVMDKKQALELIKNYD